MSILPMKISVEEIKYISRDLCPGIQKELTYLWYLSHYQYCPCPSMGVVLKKYPLVDEENPRDSSMKAFNKLFESCLNVSAKCKLISFIKYFLIEYPQYHELEKFSVMPDFDHNIESISSTNDPLPDPLVVWELNHIAPALTGMIFENIIAYTWECIDPKSCHTLQDLLLNCNEHTVSKETICNLLVRHFIKPEALKYGYSNIIVKTNKIFIANDEEFIKLKEEHFITKYHYIIWLSFMHFLKYDYKGSAVEEVFQVLDYCNKNLRLLEQWASKFKNSTFSRKLLSKFDTKEMKHGYVCHLANLRGELDILTPNNVIDIKSYKNDDVDSWAAQLFLYTMLLKYSTNKDSKDKILRSKYILDNQLHYIINVYSNEVHTFKYKDINEELIQSLFGMVQDDDE